MCKNIMDTEKGLSDISDAEGMSEFLDDEVFETSVLGF